MKVDRQMSKAWVLRVKVCLYILTLVKVMSKPRIEVTMMIPIKRKEICCDQNFTFKQKQEAHGPHRSPEKTVQINQHI